MSNAWLLSVDYWYIPANLGDFLFLLLLLPVLLIFYASLPALCSTPESVAEWLRVHRLVSAGRAGVSVGMDAPCMTLLVICCCSRHK
jgi:hypothetical protein